MRQSFLLLISLIISLQSLIAQGDFTRYSEFGGKVGYSPFNNVSMVIRNRPLTFSNSMAGIRFLHVEEKYAGAILEVTYNKSMITYQGIFYSYDFIQTPLLAHFFIPVKRGSVALNLGSYLQFIADKNDHAHDIMLERDLFFGLTGGASFCFIVKNISITIEGRLSYNFTSNSKKDYTKLGNWIDFSVAFCYRKDWKQDKKK